METSPALDSDELRVVAQRLDADGPTVDRALEVVRKFITERRLVLYGGLGIDYALRLRGKHIYPDDERPDFDVLSARNVDDAYDLADLLHELGFPKVDAIRALHVQTVRVRTNFVVVADISYVPEAVLQVLPQLEREGIPVTHPHWQFLDQHQAFCYPYRDPPKEPVFHRFKKDLTRFNLLYKTYPLPTPKPSTQPPLRPLKFPVPDGSAVCGLVGLDLLKYAHHRLSKTPGISHPVVEAKDGFSEVSMDVLAYADAIPALVVAGWATDAAAAIGYQVQKRYKPLMDIVPGAVVAARTPDAPADYPELLVIYETPGSLVTGCRLLDTPGEPDRGVFLVSPQFMLLELLLAYHVYRSSYGTVQREYLPAGASPLERYSEVMELLNSGAEMLRRAPNSIMNATPFCLSTQVIGTCNYGASQLLIMANDVKRSGLEPRSPDITRLLPSAAAMKHLPDMRYDPGGKVARPEFDYAGSSWFQRDGTLSE